MTRKAQQPPAPKAPQNSASRRRLVPPLAFLLALCFMVVCFYDAGYTSLPPTAKRYDTAKAAMENLRQDEERAARRESWEKLGAEFRSIYDADPDWPNRPAALFRLAESLEELAQRSCAKADARKTIQTYETVAARHADSRLADDALLRAARLRAAWLKDDKGALALLARIKSQYARGDMLPEALALEKTLLASAQGRTAPEARRTAKPRSREAVEEQPAPEAASKPVAVAPEAASKPVAVAPEAPEAGSKPAQAAPTDEARPPRRARAPSRAPGPDQPPNSPPDARAEAGTPGLPARPTSGHVSDMARQLGLTVRTVFIDAGHGGHDPGASHNNVLERDIALDVALTLGRLLAANGVDVAYSRTDDSGPSLRSRTAGANAANADLFVSIHVNAHASAAVHGFETYYLDLARNPEAARVAALENAVSDHRLGDMQKVLADVLLTARVDESRRLAQDIQTLSVARLRRRAFTVRDNGMKSAPFHVLLGAQMPAVLVELGYCTNAEEARNLLDPGYRQTLAEGLAEGILAYKDRLLKRRTAQNSLTQESADAM